MNILLLDSSFDLLQLALYQDFNADFNSAKFIAQVSNSSKLESAEQKSSFLQAPKIFYAANADKISKGEQAIHVLDHLLKNAQISLADIDIIAFNRGPGSFVGTRIATSIVQALVSANEELKVLSLSSLRMVAEQGLMLKSLLPAFVEDNSSALATSYIVALDANMREAYACHYLQQKDSNRLKEVASEQLLTIAQMEDLSVYSTLPAEQRASFLDSHPDLASLHLDPQHPVLLLGNAWSKYASNHSHDLLSLLKAFEQQVVENKTTENKANNNKVENLTTGNCELYLANLINLDSKQPLSNLASLPDFRFLSDYLAFLVKEAKYTNHFAIEPTYVRNNIAY